MINDRLKRGILLFLGILLVAGLAIPNMGMDYAVASQREVMLTEEERDYIEKNPVVTIAIDTSWAPFGFKKSDGGCGGIIPTVMQLTAERAGLEVRFVAKDTYADAIKACNTGETMLVSGIADDRKMAEKNDVLTTSPYMEIGYSAVTRNENSDLYTEGANYRVALCVGTYAKMAIQRKMDSYEFVEYHSNHDCLEAVRKGGADIALIANYSAEYFSNWHEFSRLQTIQINDFNWGLCFGVNKNTDPRLLGILNKSIATISANDLNQSIYAGATEAVSSTRRLGDLFYERPLLAAGLTGALVAGLALIVLILITQRKKAFEVASERSRRELQESADIVNAAMTSAKMTVWAYDVEARRITRRQGTEGQDGFGLVVDHVPESLIESGYIHPSSASEYRRAFEALPTATEPIQGDYMVQTADRLGYWWERMILTPVRENGVVTKAIGTSINVTYRKEKESQYMKLVDEMTTVDDETMIAKGRYNLSRNMLLYYKRMAEDGLVLPDTVTFDEAHDRMLETAALPEDRVKIQELLDRQRLLQQYSEGKNEGALEYKRNQKDGPVFWSLLKYTMFEEPSSGDVIFFVYTYDITERVREKSMLAKLGATEYDVLGLIDVKTHLFESKSIKGVKSLASSGNRYIQGGFEEVTHQQIMATVREGERENLEKQLTVDVILGKLEQMAVYSIAFTAVRSNHSYSRKQMNFTYLDESTTTIFYYCTDVTAMYDREQEQLHRTEEALQAARAASESKTEFFSRMSHDMRTPMNGILGIAGLSADESDTAVLKANIAKIETSGKYLLGLINDTLDFQRIESGKLTLEPEIVRCSDVVQAAMDMVRPTMEKKHIRFHAVNHNVMLDCMIRVDPVRIKQVFINLVSNAVKFTPDGGEIFFEYECLERKEMISRDRFTIRDTGIGMSEHFIKNRIFKPFEQEHNAVSGQYAGSGLGLSIVKRLVDLMGGTITVESELGAGTTFVVCLDIERVRQEEAEEAAVHLAMKQSDVLQRLHGRSILLAEDHPLNAEIAMRLLEKAGCQATWAKDGKECVELYKDAAKGTFDAILMDIRMPVMDGLAAAREIRKLGQADAGTIPIIAMTANAYDEDVKKSLEAGMNTHLAKPIEPEKMYEAIAAVLRE